MKIIYKDFLEFLKLLKDNNVQYLIVGGYAVAFHGYPRMTMDIYLWIKISSENAKNIVKAIRKFGFESDELKKDIFEKPNNIVRMEVKPQLIEILTAIYWLTGKQKSLLWISSSLRIQTAYIY